MSIIIALLISANILIIVVLFLIKFMVEPIVRTAIDVAYDDISENVRDPYAAAWDGDPISHENKRIETMR